MFTFHIQVATNLYFKNIYVPGISVYGNNEKTKLHCLITVSKFIFN